MKKRDIAQIAILALLVASVMSLALYSEQNRKRSMANILAICQQFEEITKLPCALKLPPAGIADGDRRTESGVVMMTRTEPRVRPLIRISAAECPVLGNINSRGVKIYHTMSSRYRSMVSPEECFATEEEAKAAGYRAPG